ncbi:MAG: NUDIX hydrolase [Alphaproteobacteria bacterium]
MADKKEPVPIKPASTILLLRDGADDMEVLMVERHHQIDFASGALVFPGGKVDPADGIDNPADIRPLCDCADDFDDLELAFRVAAIRESFEESGMLLARKDGALAGPDHVAALSDARDALNARETTMGEIAATHSLTLALDLLQPFARWVTPAFMHKRFDTMFYLARVPEGQIEAHDGSEAVDTVWISPQAALTAAEAGERTIIFPTRKNVEKLGRTSNVEEAFAAAVADDIVTVEPWMEKNGDKHLLKLPPEAGYGDGDEPLDAIMGG